MDVTLYVGEIAALLTAAVWAAAALIWVHVGRYLRPLLLNMTKNLIAAAILFGVALLLGLGLFNLPPGAALLFAASGALGIGIGDTFYLQSLNRLGPAWALLITMLTPPLTVLMGWVFLGETLGGVAIAGVALTVIGVGWVVLRPPQADNVDAVVSEADPERPAASVPDQTPQALRVGVGLALLGVLLQSASMIVNRQAFVLGGADADALVSTVYRLAAGGLVLAVLLPMVKPVASLPPVWRVPTRVWYWLGATTLISTAGGMLLMQVAVERASNAGVVQTLLSASPLFVIPMVALAGQRVGGSTVLGGLVAIAGVAMLFAG
ncbi:MAG: DMT family transporter [Planctomycetota bacterium]